MTFKTYLLFIFLLSITFNSSAQKDVKFWHLTVNNGLSNNFTTCFLQDSKGFMWIGSQDGLNRYDGYGFEVYRHHTKNQYSLSNNFINALYEDEQQNIWVGTEGGGLCKYESKYDRFQKIPEVKSNTVAAFLEDKQKKLWIAAGNSLYRLDIQSNKFIIHSTFTMSNITSLCVIDANSLLVGTMGAGVYVFDIKTGNAQQYAHQENNTQSLCDNNVICLYRDKQGIIWIGTEKGLDKFNIQKQIFEHLTLSPNQKKSLLVESIRKIIGIENEIWIGTENGGLSVYHLDSDTFTHYTPDQADTRSLNDASVWALYQDKQKRVWIGTYSGGVSIFDPYREKFLKPNIILKNKTVNAILKDSKNRLWIGTEGGLVMKAEANTFYYTHSDLQSNSLLSNPVLAIFEDNQHRIWVGTWEGGLSMFNEKDDTFINFKANPNHINKLTSSKIWRIHQSSLTGQMLITSFGGLHILTNENTQDFLNYVHQPQDTTSISDNWGRIMYEDTKKNLWIGTMNGLNRFDINTKKFTRFIHNKKDINSLSNNTINAILEDKKGRLWIGTSDGLNQMLNDSKFIAYTVADGLPNGSINGILEDDNGNLWLSTNNGIAKFNPETKKVRQYDEGDGLQSRQFRDGAFFKAKDGQLFFGGVNGFNAFYPNNIKDNPHIPAVIIKGLKIFNQSVKIGDYDSLLTKDISQTKEINLDYRHSVFSFDFVALNFTQFEKNQYAYTMENFEKEWNYVGSKREATYTNLDAGTYTFRVKASNNDGLWNEEGVTLKIIILPPWWETWWFRLLVLLLVSFSAYSFYKVRTNFLKEQNLKLENQVQERTQEIVNKGKELELANHQIKTKNEELQASEEELRQNMEELETNQELLQKQKDTIESAFQQLHIQSTKVKDSIRYAQRIQNAILPHEDVLKSAFVEFFVIFKPKDVVSGDFYWYTELQSGINNLESGGKPSGISNQPTTTSNQQPTNHQQPTTKKFLAVVDCTGHGVPGAFMSMIGNTLLHEIVNAKRIETPHLILQELHLGVLNSLNKKEARVQDGMDIALCCIENQKNGEVKVQFSGAKRSLYYFSNQMLHELFADRKSIGQTWSDILYKTQEITLQKGDILYMTTDGWIDSINPERKRFGNHRFREMLVSGANLPLYAQKEVFTTILEEYEQGAEQRDDVLMVGVRA